MFQRALVVKVVDGIVTFAIRTDDGRVDEFKFLVARFREILIGVKEEGNCTHIYLPIVLNYTVVFAVYTPEFRVMVSEFEAQAK